MKRLVLILMAFMFIGVSNFKDLKAKTIYKSMCILDTKTAKCVNYQAKMKLYFYKNRTGIVYDLNNNNKYKFTYKKSYNNKLIIYVMRVKHMPKLTSFVINNNFKPALNVYFFTKDVWLKFKRIK